MMISYLYFSLITLTSKPVPQDHPANLFDLIGFCFRAERLQIQNFLHAFTGEDVMAAANPFRKAQMTQQTAQALERNISIRSPAQDLHQQLLMLAHAGKLSQVLPYRQHETFGGRFAAADAVGEAGPFEGVAAEGEGGAFVQALADACDARGVAEVVLRHRARPLLDMREERGRCDAEQVAEVLADGRRHAFVVEGEHLRLERAA